MTDSERERIKELVENGTSFAIASQINPAGPDEKELLARGALQIALHERGAAVYCFPELPKEVKNKWDLILAEPKNSGFLYSTSIHIPKSKANIKEVSYLDEGDYFTISISSAANGINKDSIIIEPNPVPVDALFVFYQNGGFPSVMEKKILPPEEDKIIRLPSNGAVSTNDVYLAIKSFGGENISGQTATLLLASLIIETDNFSQNVSEENLRLGSILLGLGADKAAVRSIIKGEVTYSFAQLLGRALARTRNNKETRSVWVFLSDVDLKKTGYNNAGEDVFKNILKKIKGIVPQEQHYLILWQTDGGVMIMRSSRDDFSISGPHANFSEAEIKTQQKLKEY